MFSLLQRISNTIGTRGRGEINYDDNDDKDDDDEDNNDDDA